jgi:20S proteasome subunit beta 1
VVFRLGSLEDNIENMKWYCTRWQISLGLVIFGFAGRLVSYAHNLDEVSMGTTIMAAKFRGGVVVGADTRTSVSGYVSNRFASKLTFVLDPSSSQVSLGSGGADKKVTPASSTCCLCRSGSAADTQHLAYLVEQELLARELLSHLPGTVTSAAFLARTLLRENLDWSCGLICAGFDHVANKGKIFSIASSGAIVEEPMLALGGSGSSYVAGHVESTLQEHHLQKKKKNTTISGCANNGNDLMMSEEECVDLVGRTIELAMSSDTSSGGYVRLYIIDKYGARPMIRMPTESLGRS